MHGATVHTPYSYCGATMHTRTNNPSTNDRTSSADTRTRASTSTSTRGSTAGSAVLGGKITRIRSKNTVLAIERPKKNKTKQNFFKNYYRLQASVPTTHFTVDSIYEYQVPYEYS
eukprot:scaffold21859_cov20-Prasinocladus_malaysianus.AAC.1